MKVLADNLKKKAGHETKFYDMTDEEYDALDELLTHANPELTGIPGVFAVRGPIYADTPQARPSTKSK
jgi:hypothetical protein